MGGRVYWSVLQDPESWDTMEPMSVINQKTGMVNVFQLLPRQGDQLIITNRGTHIEIRHLNAEIPQLGLTDEELELLAQGLITWN